MADRIEAGTFCVAATLAKGTLEINNLDPKIINTSLNLIMLRETSNESKTWRFLTTS